MNKNIAVLGCGWLGVPLAKKLIALGYVVHGSTQTPSKLSALKSEGIVPFLIGLNETQTEGDVKAFLKNCHVLIINIPPRLKQHPRTSFVNKIKSFLFHLDELINIKVIFVSSTSVFKDTPEISCYDEFTKPNGNLISGKQLAETETLLLSKPHLNTKIIRFGGLFGAGRHPARFLSNRPLKNPNSPVNLIHLEDCLALILKIIDFKGEPFIFHGIYPNHPKKMNYYSAICETKNIEPPLATDYPNVGKIINSEITSKLLNFNYKNNLFATQ